MGCSGTQTEEEHKCREVERLMTREETKQILDIIMRAYPRMRVVETKEDVDLWHECLDDLEYPKARTATINIVKRTKDFPPDIATIREEYDSITKEQRSRDIAVRDTYRNLSSIYTDSGTIDKYLPIFRKRCNNDPSAAAKLKTALQRFAETEYQWLPNLGQAIMCIDIERQTIPDEMMEIVQKYKSEPLPDEILRNYSKMEV